MLSRNEAPRLPELALSLGGTEAVAAFDGGSGTSALRFRYTVQAGDFDGDGISVAAGPNALVGGRIEDAAGEVVPRDFGALPARSGHRVDAVRASAVDIEIVSAPIGEDYGLGETIEVEVAFDEVVHVTADGGELQLVLAVGEHSRRATFVDGSGTDTLSFAYRVEPDDRDDDGISIGPDALVGGVIEDIAGNETEEAGRRLPALPAQPGHRVNPDLDRIAPTVVRVAVRRCPPMRPTASTRRSPWKWNSTRRSTSAAHRPWNCRSARPRTEPASTRAAAPGRSHSAMWFGPAISTTTASASVPERTR